MKRCELVKKLEEEYGRFPGYSGVIDAIVEDFQNWIIYSAIAYIMRGDESMDKCFRDTALAGHEFKWIADEEEELDKDKEVATIIEGVRSLATDQDCINAFKNFYSDFVDDMGYTKSNKDKEKLLNKASREFKRYCRECFDLKIA